MVRLRGRVVRAATSVALEDLLLAQLEELVRGDEPGALDRARGRKGPAAARKGDE